MSLPLRRDAHGVYQLATLLTEMDAEDETSCLLAGDALYRLGRLDDAHKSLLVALSRRPQAAPVLVRLALLQLRRGFCYAANQVSRHRSAGAGRDGHSSAGDAMHLVVPDLLPTAWTLGKADLTRTHFPTCIQPSPLRPSASSSVPALGIAKGPWDLRGACLLHSVLPVCFGCGITKWPRTNVS